MVLYGFLGWLIFSPMAAQTPNKRLTGAILYLSVDDWGDIWLNGNHIVDHQPYTSSRKGSATIRCLPEHLCYFHKENILAIEDTEAISTALPDHVGIAYLLRLFFSDRTETTLSSNETDQHLSYYVGDPMAGDPMGWQEVGYDDSKWGKAYNAGPLVPHAAPLDDPESQASINFLSAFGETYITQNTGERHLYRRKFHLDIIEKSDCQPTPTVLFRLLKPKPEPALNPTFLPTPLVTTTPTSFPSPAPTDTPVPITVSNSRVRTTPTPQLVLKPTLTPYFQPPIPTRTPILLIRWTPTPSPRIERAVVFTPEPILAVPQTVIFSGTSANIYVTFEDGPGDYRVEVVDGQGNHLKTLFSKRMSVEAEKWLEWDGKDDQGNEMPPGQYFALYSKDGKVLQKIVVVRSADNP